MIPNTVDRVTSTPDTDKLIDKLITIHGPLLFHQSGGCCDGSAPMCYPAGEFITGSSDAFLGHLTVPTPAGDVEVPFWMSKPQFEYWRHTHLTVDVVPGRGAGFSLEAPYGLRFLIRSRLLTDAELVALGDV